MNKRRREEGSVALLVALAGLVLMGFAALVIDGGRIYLEQHRIQNAVDSAALAGAAVLSRGVDTARAAALDYANKNGVADPTVYVDLNLKTVRVEAARELDMGLARAIGIAKANPGASADAGPFPLVAAQGAVPLGVVWQDFVFGVPYDLKMGDGATGNFGALALGGRGTSEYESNLRYGFPGFLHQYDVLQTETGNMSDPTKRAIEGRIAACHHWPACTPSSFAPDCPRVVLVPVISPPESGRTTVTVVGFASFFLEGYVGEGTDNYVRGRFIRTVEKGEPGTIPGFGYGTYVVRLTK